MATFTYQHPMQGRFAQQGMGTGGGNGTFSAGMAALRASQPQAFAKPQTPAGGAPNAPANQGTMMRTIGQDVYGMDPNTGTWGLIGGPNFTSGYGVAGRAGNLPNVMPQRDVDNLQGMVNQGQAFDPGFGNWTNPQAQFTQNRMFLGNMLNPTDYGAANMMGRYANPYQAQGMGQLATAGGQLYNVANSLGPVQGMGQLGQYSGRLGQMGTSNPAIQGMGQLGQAAGGLMAQNQAANMSRFLNSQGVNIDPVIEALRKDYTTQLQEAVLPGLRSGALASGQYGGSRQAIAEGVANAKANEEFQQQAANLRYQNELEALNRQMQAAQFADTMRQQGLTAGGQLAGQRAGLDISNLARRAEALQAAGGLAAQRGQLDLSRTGQRLQGLAQAGELAAQRAGLDQSQRAQQMQAVSAILGARQAGSAQALAARQAQLQANEAARQRAMQALLAQQQGGQFTQQRQLDAARSLADIAAQYYGYQSNMRAAEANRTAASAAAGSNAATQRELAKMQLGPQNINAISNLINALGVGYQDILGNSRTQANQLANLGSLF